MNSIVCGICGGSGVLLEDGTKGAQHAEGCPACKGRRLALDECGHVIVETREEWEARIYGKDRT